MIAWSRIVVSCWLCLAVCASGCATIVKGTDQTVTVQSMPSGASCELKRGGKLIGVVNPTPGSITADKSQDDISVICRKNGYQEASGVLSSEFQGMTFGNILFGGVIGAAIDASSGASHKYPESVSIALAPVSFGSDEERDKFFDERAQKILQDAEIAISKVKQNCKSGQQQICDDATKKLERLRDDQLADLEVQRATDDTLIELAASSEVNPAAKAPDITVSPAVMDEIARYLRQTNSSSRVWALAIARDGSVVASASCPTSGDSGGTDCRPSHGTARDLASRKALTQCGGASRCVLLYQGKAKKTDLEVGVL